ncbi:hypothetical protein GCM10023075_27620 [Streptosporangium album]
MGGQQGLGVTAEAQVGVDRDGVGTRERGSQELKHSVEHHGHVAARGLKITHVVLGAHEAQTPLLPPRSRMRGGRSPVSLLAPTPGPSGQVPIRTHVSARHLTPGKVHQLTCMMVAGGDLAERRFHR